MTSFYLILKSLKEKYFAASEGENLLFLRWLGSYTLIDSSFSSTFFGSNLEMCLFLLQMEAN